MFCSHGFELISYLLHTPVKCPGGGNEISWGGKLSSVGEFIQGIVAGEGQFSTQVECNWPGFLNIWQRRRHMQ